MGCGCQRPSVSHASSTSASEPPPSTPSPPGCAGGTAGTGSGGAGDVTGAEGPGMGTQLLGVGLDLCWPPCPPMDLAEREQALQRCCVELDGRERRWKIAGAVSRLAAEVPVSPWAGGGPAGPPLTPCSPGAGMPMAQDPGWDARAGLWGGPNAGRMQEGPGDVGMRAGPGEGGARDAAVPGAGRGGVPGRTWP